MKLADLQGKFQDAILGGDRDILQSINPSRKLDGPTRFAVYSDAYRSRLAGFLAEDFKVLHEAVGDEDFNALAAAYIDVTPSQHPNARWYARRLPDFMQRSEPWRDYQRCIDLAVFERALADAFDATDAEALQVNVLAGTAPEVWPQLSFDFQESISLMTLGEGTVAVYEAIVEERDPPADAGNGAETIIVWRDPTRQVLYRRLDDAETLALTEARAGKTFGEICSLLAFRDEGDPVAERAARYLAQWFADGLITRTDRS